jgi:hypothetical protein
MSETTPEWTLRGQNCFVGCVALMMKVHPNEVLRDLAAFAASNRCSEVAVSSNGGGVPDKLWMPWLKSLGWRGWERSKDTRWRMPDTMPTTCLLLTEDHVIAMIDGVLLDNNEDAKSWIDILGFYAPPTRGPLRSRLAPQNEAIRHGRVLEIERELRQRC